MVTDWSALGGDPVPAEAASLLAAAERLEHDADEASTIQTAVLTLTGKTPSVWRGQAGSAWQSSSERAAHLLEVPAAHFRRAATCLRRFAVVVAQLRAAADPLPPKANSLRAELDELESPFQQLSLPSPSLLPPGSPAAAAFQQRQAHVANLRTQLDALQRQADQLHIDYRTARAGCVRTLDEIATDGIVAHNKTLTDAELKTLAGIASAHTVGDMSKVGGVLLAAMPAAQRAGLFADLTPDVALALAMDDPDVSGNLDGIPFAIRADVNAHTLDRDLAAARAAGDSAKVKLLQGLTSGGGAVIMYDPQRDHYGVMFGDIEAHDVAVFVPGVGDDSNVSGWVADAFRIQSQTRPPAAVIMWKGYDDPGDHGFADKANAAFTGRATDGAAALTTFCRDGLNLASGQSLTIVAHSYGSVVTGVALNQDGLTPDRVVTAGSPGMTVDSISQLHLQPGQFFAEHAPHDPVANNLAGFGTDPSSPSFGGNRLATNADGMTAVQGHSSYFSAGSQALQGTADVITGHVTPADIQTPTASNHVGAVAVRLINPAGPLLDDLARTYHGPHQGELQLGVHVLNGTANNLGVGAQNTYDAVKHELHELETLLP